MIMNNEGPFGIPGEIIPCEEISDQAVLSRTPLVSVHMITYNHEPYIAQAIKGVLQQKTDFQIELIIGEDRSTDRTREIVLEYQKRYPAIIRVITSEKNVGMHRNHRRVYAASRGKYIAYCEGDDYWHHPSKLQKQVDFLELNPDVGMIHSNGVKYITKKRKIFPYFSQLTLNTILKYDLTDNISKAMLESKYFVITCSVVARKNLIVKIYDTCKYEFKAEHLSGDFQTWMELANRSKVKFINEVLVTYNVLEESAFNSDDPWKILKFILYTLDIRLFYANKYGGFDTANIKNVIIRRVIQRIVELGFNSRKKQIAEKAFEIAKRHNIKFGIVDFFYFFGSQSFLTYYIVWILLLPNKILNSINFKLKQIIKRIKNTAAAVFLGTNLR
jgi:glycosyltransferase involved in cell wall biosynthesis